MKGEGGGGRGSRTTGAALRAVVAVSLFFLAAPGAADVENVRLGNSGEHRLVRYDAGGRPLVRFSGFGLIRDMARYDDSTVILAEYDANRVTAVDLAGEIKWSHELRRPHCVSVVGPDRIFVCQHEPPTLVEINRAGEVLWSMPVDLSRFGGAARLADGGLVIAGMRKSGVVEVLSAGGQLVWSVADDLTNPQGVVALPDGRVAVSNFDAEKITLLRPGTRDRVDIRFCCHARQIGLTRAGGLISASPESQRIGMWTLAGDEVGGFATKYPALDAIDLADGSVLVAEHAVPDRTCLNVAATAARRTGSGPSFLRWLAIGLLGALALALLIHLPVLDAWLRRPWHLTWRLPEVDSPAREVARRVEVALYLAALAACLGAAAHFHSQALARHRIEAWPLAGFVFAGGVLLAVVQMRTPGAGGSWGQRMAAMPPMAASTWRMWLSWLAAIVAGVAALAGIYDGVYGWEPAAWMAAMVLFALGSIAPPRRQQARANPRVVAGAVLLAVLLLGLRVFELADWPRQIHQDMAVWGVQAKRLMDGDTPMLFANDGWADIPLVGYLWSSLFSGMSDQPIASARIAAALGSLLAILAASLLAARMAGTAAAFCAAVLLGVNQTFLHFSRIQAYMDPVPFGVLAVFCLLRGFEVGRYGWFALAGLSGGFAALGYHSGRITPIVMITVAAIVIARYPRALVHRWRGLVLCGVAALATIGPQGLVYLLGRADALGRVGQYLWYTHGEVDWDLLWQTIANGVPRVFGSFWFYRDSSTQYSGATHLFPVTAALLGTSTVAAVIRFWDVRGLLLVVWASLIFFVGGVLTVDPPFYPRLVQVLVPVCVLIALTVAALSRAVSFAAGRAGLWLSISLVGALLVFDARHQLVSYWRFLHGIQVPGQPPRANVQTPQSLLGRDLLQWDADTRIYFVAANPIEHSCAHPTIRFFADALDSSDARDLGDHVPFADRRRVVAYFRKEDEAEAKWLLEVYPGAELSTVTNNLGDAAYYRVVVPPRPE